MAAQNYSGYAVDKPTSRVLNPPGGRSNNIFGAYEEPAAAAPVNRNKQTNNVLNDNSNINGSSVAAANADQSCANGRYHIDRNKSNVFGDDHSNQSANKPRRGFNPITGKAYEEEEEDRKKSTQIHVQQQKDDKLAQEHKHQQQLDQQQSGAPVNNYHSSTKIHQPPGGKSTRLW